jgi:hypothetical protein
MKHWLKNGYQNNIQGFGSYFQENRNIFIPNNGVLEV